MNNIEFLEKVSKANNNISYNELRKTFFMFPINEFNELNNLESVLTCNEVEMFTNAKDLIFFIESRSRQLSAKTAETKELLEKKRNKRLFDEAQKTKEENNQLFFSIMESQGLMGSKNTSECVGCGIVVAVNAQCKC